MVSQSKAVFIRGLDQTLYYRFVAKAKEQGKTVGDLMNQTMRETIQGKGESQNLDPYTLVIGGSVHLSRDDILGIYKEVGKEFSIENTGHLTLDQDIDREALRCIEKIKNTGSLRAPKHLHHLVLLKIGQIYGAIEKY
ncbi:MAG: hypothetical protein AOA65_0668 [Candidatus Bathyarchaeota archaeon BA1]|nr:MAG: hypothetical protein AOA65_0668 [Candidatus Bathyarchaeota archaeon BA1]